MSKTLNYISTSLGYSGYHLWLFGPSLVLVIWQKAMAFSIYYSSRAGNPNNY